MLMFCAVSVCSNHSKTQQDLLLSAQDCCSKRGNRQEAQKNTGKNISLTFVWGLKEQSWILPVCSDHLVKGNLLFVALLCKIS